MIQLGHILAKRANMQRYVCLKLAHASTTHTHAYIYIYIYIYTHKILAVGRKHQLGHIHSKRATQLWSDL